MPVARAAWGVCLPGLGRVAGSRWRKWTDLQLPGVVKPVHEVGMPLNEVREYRTEAGGTVEVEAVPGLGRHRCA